MKKEIAKSLEEYKLIPDNKEVEEKIKQNQVFRMGTKNYLKKEHIGLLFLMLFHLVYNIRFLQESNMLQFIGGPHYYLNFHLKIILGLLPFEGHDLLLVCSWLLSKILGSSLLSIKLAPTVAFLLLIGVVYAWISFLFINRRVGLFAACLVSFSPENIFYSRCYEHHIFLIAIIYLSIYLITKFLLIGSKASFAMSIPVLYLGANSIGHDFSFELVFLLYVGSFFIVVFKQISKNKRILNRYYILGVLLVLASFPEIKLLFSNYGYYLKEGLELFGYPDNWGGWICFLSFYSGYLASTLFIIPAFIFLFVFICFLRICPEKKIYRGVNSSYFINALFLPLIFFSFVCKKQLFYVSPLISWSAIILAVGTMLIENRILRRGIIAILLGFYLIFFFSFTSVKSIKYLTGEKFLDEYQKAVWDCLEVSVGAQAWTLVELSASNNNYERVKEGFLANSELVKEQSLKKFLSFLSKERKIAEPDIVELVVLEYLLEKKRKNRLK